MDNELARQQRLVCERVGAEPLFVEHEAKVGMAANVRDELWPLNGLRHPVVGDTSGWYIWAGEELSQDPDFFVPMHAKHLTELRPELARYLALPPGWRFLIAPDYEDLWLDESLLEQG